MIDAHLLLPCLLSCLTLLTWLSSAMGCGWTSAARGPALCRRCCAEHRLCPVSFLPAGAQLLPADLGSICPTGSREGSGAGVRAGWSWLSHSAPGATQGLGRGATRILREMALVERMSSGSGNTWGFIWRLSVPLQPTSLWWTSPMGSKHYSPELAPPLSTLL